MSVTNDGAVGVEDVGVAEVWKTLQVEPSAVLIDVRTRAEWTFVGLPDLSSIGKQVLTIEWQNFPEGQVNPAFGGQLVKVLDDQGADRDTALFFICRSGARSRMAGEAAIAAGYSKVTNVAEGFEGPPNGQRQRGKIAGWKAEGLPWVQG